MTSRLLAELEAQASTTQDRVAWSIITCRISINLSRQGRIAAAQERILSVRKLYGTELNHIVASWVMLAEGILNFAKEDPQKAHERIIRAYSLAVALRTESAKPICAAWMALLEFNRAKYDDMARYLEEALVSAQKNDHQALGRASLVLADAIHYSKSYELAKHWYEAARLHATAEGDQAMLGAMLFNVAAIRSGHLRLADAFGDVPADQLLRASMEATSSITYDLAVGSTSFGTLWRLLHAELKIIEKDYGAARVYLNSIDEKKVASKDLSLYLLNSAWCHLKLKDSESCDSYLSRAEGSEKFIIEADDLAFYHARYAQICRARKKYKRSEKHMAAALQFRQEHQAAQAAIFSKIEHLIDKK